MTQTAKPLIGLGTAISIGTQGGSPTYTAIGGNTRVTPPQPKYGTVKTTTLSSANNSDTFLKTIIDQGEIALDGFWESADAGQAALYAAFLAPSNQANGSAYPFKLVDPINEAGGQTSTGDTLVVYGHVTSFAQGDVEPDKPIPYKASIKIDGATAPVLTLGS